MWTETQLERIEVLRREREDGKAKKKKEQYERKHTFRFKIGDRVSHLLDGVYLIGYIVAVRENEWDVRCKYGTFTVGLKGIRPDMKPMGPVKDYSQVVVSEKIKKMGTAELIRNLPGFRTRYKWYDDIIHGWREQYNEDEIRAELITRPHIPNKREVRKIEKLIAEGKIRP